MKIVIGGLKGGLGKTTTAINLATALGNVDPTALIDCDPQSQSAFDWYNLAYSQHSERMPFAVIPWATLDLADKVAGLREQYRNIVIDAGGGAEALFKAACVAVGRDADDPGELLIPCRPNLGELRRIPATLAAAGEVQALTGATVYPRVLLVDVPTHTPVDERNARAFLASQSIPTMDARVRHSVYVPRQFGHAIDDLGDYADVAAELLVDVEAPA